MSHETIYQTLYVPGRGELRRELTSTATAAPLRKPQRCPTSAFRAIRHRWDDHDRPQKPRIDRVVPGLQQNVLDGLPFGDRGRL
ncbi:hypothetical protein [Streptomyces sannanensis]|uniref:hypothetical protein n=1 Tax=Streptomyces sannanensis TaxID=285536 RepID=UPI0031ED5485